MIRWAMIGIMLAGSPDEDQLHGPVRGLFAGSLLSRAGQRLD
jgi:hypothetical protein